ncbi:MAG: hypothetical protein R3C24_07235 [Cyanobacteriota/Melainabacteria group bacterium]
MNGHDVLTTVLRVRTISFIFAFVAPVVLFGFYAPCLADSEFASSSSSGSGNSTRLLHQQTWSPSIPATTQSVELVAQIYSEGNFNWGNLKILRDKKVVFTFNPGPMYADSLFILDNGNLACRWSEGMGSTHRFVVFGFFNGTVRVLLDLESEGLVQEFVYPLRGKILLNSGENVQPYEHRIINPIVDWIIPKRKRASELQPIAADIYTWNSSSNEYSVRKNVPWDRRFLRL